MFREILNSETVHIAAPFVFIFAIVYGSMELAGLFKNKGVSSVISLAIALIAVSNERYVSFVWKYMPIASLVFGVVFIAGFLLEIAHNFATKTKNIADAIGISVGNFYPIVGVILFSTFLGLNSATISNIIRNIGIDLTTIIFITGFLIVAGLILIAHLMGMFSQNQRDRRGDKVLKKNFLSFYDGKVYLADEL